MDRISEISTIIHVLIDVIFRTSVLGIPTVFFYAYIWIFLIKIKQILQSIEERLPNRLLGLMRNSWWLIIIGLPRMIVLNCTVHGVVLCHVEILTTHFVSVEQARASLHHSI